MNERDIAAAEKIADGFLTEGSRITLAPHGSGHINDTYLVVTRASGKYRRYVLQRLNGSVFKHPWQVMENIIGVTTYLGKQKQLQGMKDMQVLTLVPAKDGKLYQTDESDQLWRMYDFVENTVSFDLPENARQFYHSGCGFGDFFRLLADYPAETLYETIEGFHDTPARLRQLDDAIAHNRAGRAAAAEREIEFVRQHESLVPYLHNKMLDGALPLRVTHNDTKLNNVLLDAKTGESVCVIDLDTVMPGLIAYDFGDAMRFGTNTAAEDERDLSKCSFSLPMFEAFSKGYLEHAGGYLTDAELSSLPYGAVLMTLECGIRFLADHINGDVYFKVHRENHNLDRCRTQFRLAEDMLSHMDDMDRIIRTLSK